MKLIDRDKFISDMFDLYIEQKWKPSDIHFSLLDVRNNIDFKEYEVKAIPIERIEKYAKRFIELENRNYFAYRGFSDIGEAILNMLENWEKENETN